MKVFEHDPQANLDYSWDFSQWLQAGETITSAVVPLGANTTHTDAVVTSWLSGITIRTRVTCHIVTNQGREDDRSIILEVKER